MAVAQRTTESAMIGMSSQHLKTNEWVGSKTKVPKTTNTIKTSKQTLADLIARITVNRWTSRVMDWRQTDDCWRNDCWPKDRLRKQRRTKWKPSGNSLHGGEKHKTCFFVWKSNAEGLISQGLNMIMAWDQSLTYFAGS